MNIIQKGMTIAVITLFIGVAVAPSINANVSKEALVEFTTEVCGLNGGKQTVKLTQEDAEEIERLVNDIQSRLDKVETREELVAIFNQGIVELDKYRLLPNDMSVEKAKQLITGKFQKPWVTRLFERIGIKQKENRNNVSGNSFCLTFIGRKEDSYSFEILLSYRLVDFLNEYDMPKLAELFFYYCFFKPFRFMSMFMLFSSTTHNPKSYPFIFTLGLQGIQNTEMLDSQHLLCLGFTGIHIKYNLKKYNYENFDEFYLGFSIIIIGPDDHLNESAYFR